MKTKDIRPGVKYAVRRAGGGPIVPGYALPGDKKFTETSSGPFEPIRKFREDGSGAKAHARSGLILCVVLRDRYAPAELPAEAAGFTLEQALLTDTDNVTPGLPASLAVIGVRSSSILETWLEYLKDHQRAEREANAAASVPRVAAEAQVLRDALVARGVDIGSEYAGVVQEHGGGSVRLSFTQARALLGIPDQE